jgi:hypothetical protein
VVTIVDSLLGPHRVDSHCDRATGEFAHALLETLAIADRLAAESAHDVETAFPCGADDPRAQQPRLLQSAQAHRPGRSMQQHSVLRTDAGHSEQLSCGRTHQDEPGSLGEAERGGLGKYAVRSYPDLGGVAT